MAKSAPALVSDTHTHTHLSSSNVQTFKRRDETNPRAAFWVSEAVAGANLALSKRMYFRPKLGWNARAESTRCVSAAEQPRVLGRGELVGWNGMVKLDGEARRGEAGRWEGG